VHYTKPEGGISAQKQSLSFFGGASLARKRTFGGQEVRGGDSTAEKVGRDSSFGRSLIPKSGSAGRECTEKRTSLKKRRGPPFKGEEKTSAGGGGGILILGDEAGKGHQS